MSPRPPVIVRLLLLAMGLVISSFGNAQDLIQVRDSVRIRAYVVDITPQAVHYRFADDTLATRQTVPTAKVEYIEFAQGLRQPFPLPGGQLPDFLRRPDAIDALTERVVAAVPVVAAPRPPALVAVSGLNRVGAVNGLHHLWRIELGIVNDMSGVAAARMGLRSTAEWPVFATHDLRNSLHLGMLLLARQGRHAAPDSLRATQLLAESHVLPFVSASWRQRVGSSVYLIGRVALSPGRVVRAPSYDPFEQRLRYNTLFFGGGSQLVGISAAIPFSRLRPCFGLVAGIEFYRSAFSSTATRYRQQLSQASLGFTF